MSFTNTAGPSTSPQDFSDMNITDEDPIRRASPDHTMVAKTSNNGGYHAPTKTDIPLIVSLLIRPGETFINLFWYCRPCNPSRSKSEQSRYLIPQRDIGAETLLRRMQPSYAQDLGVGAIEHGVYGSFINALGLCLGVVGAIPCCPVRTIYVPTL
jgi:hypothetical protein